MNKSLLLLLVLITTTIYHAKGQTKIESFFYGIALSDLDKAEKKKLISKHTVYKLDNTLYINKSDIPKDRMNYQVYTVKDFLPKSGYLSFSEHITFADEGGYDYEMCYWNVSNGDKLIASNSTKHETVSFDVLQFYKFNNGKISKLQSEEILPSFQYKDLVHIDMIKTDGLNPNEFKSIFNKIIRLSYKLPEKGKSLIIYPEFDDYNLETEQENTILRTYSKYLKEKLVLKWNDGTFLL